MSLPRGKAGLSDAGATSSGSGPVFVGITEITSLDSPYTVLPTDYLIFANSAGGNIIINLPAVAGARRRRIEVKRRSLLNTVTVTPNGAETIDTAPTLVLAAGVLSAASVTAPPTGTDWAIT